MIRSPSDVAKKVCIRCSEIKPLSAFYAHPRMADGRLNKCKECTKRDVKQNRLSRLAYYRTYDLERSRRPERRANMALQTIKMRTEKPRAARAHRAVRWAVSSGKLKAKSCETCGANKALAHHDDYARPLDVRWLCQPCHVAWHHANGPGLNGAKEDAA